LIVLGTASAATVVETYASVGAEQRFTNAVAEIVLSDGASLEHYRVVEEGQVAFHVEMTEVHQSRDSVYASLSVNTGAAIGRNDLRVRLAGLGASCTLNGISISQSNEHVDNHTLIDHAEPHGTSRQLYKGILDDKSRTVFNGKIVVRPGAQRTDAQQANQNLLLSQDATIDTKPQLEILADDVKCTHGATVGQIDEDMVFYLKSRGLGTEASRGILTYGFASELIEDVRHPSVRTHLDRLLAEKLSGGAPDGLGEPWAEAIKGAEHV
jgi:Fe-S cluster assembly protein SufD